MSIDLSWVVEGLKKPGKTQRGMAKAIGISESQVSRLLSGKRHLRAKDIEAICSYLDVEAPDALGVVLQKDGKDSIILASAKAVHQTLSSAQFSDAEARAIALAIIEAAIGASEKASSVSSRLIQIIGNSSQREFAASLGVSAQAVNQWVMGRTTPSTAMLKKIAALHNADIGWLLTGQRLEGH